MTLSELDAERALVISSLLKLFAKIRHEVSVAVAKISKSNR